MLAPVVVGAEVDRLLFEALEQVGGGRGDARFRVALGGRVIAVDVAEVALPVDQRVAHGEILRETRQRVVDRLVAVRVIVAHRVADDLGALQEAAVRRQPQLVHGVEDAPVHGLQAVAHVGQRAVHDGRQRVRQVALFQRVLEVDRLDAAGAGQNRFFGHGNGLARAGRPGKPQVVDAARSQQTRAMRHAACILAAERAFSRIDFWPDDEPRRMRHSPSPDTLKPTINRKHTAGPVTETCGLVSLALYSLLGSHLMTNGTVKFYNAQKGYGFIAPDGGDKDVFVHASALERAGIHSLNEGQKVSFEAGEDRKSGKISVQSIELR